MRIILDVVMTTLFYFGLAFSALAFAVALGGSRVPEPLRSFVREVFSRRGTP